MPVFITVLLAAAALAVLAGVVYVVLGKGGQLARFEADHPPLDLPTDRPITGTDVARVLLPLAMWGYNVRAVDEVLRRLAGTLRDQELRIAELERRLAAADPAFGGPEGAEPERTRAGHGSYARTGAEAWAGTAHEPGPQGEGRAFSPQEYAPPAAPARTGSGAERRTGEEGGGDETGARDD